MPQALEKKKQKVIFRKIHGRIVPIKVKESETSRLERALKLAAVGSTTALISGVTAGAVSSRAKLKYARKSRIFAQRASLFEARGNRKLFAKHFRTALIAGKKATASIKASKFILKGGTFVGGALLGSAAAQFVPSGDTERTEAVKGIAGGIAGVLTQAVAFKIFKKKAFPFLR